MIPLLIMTVQFLIATALLLGWFYIAMWYLRRIHHIRDEGLIVYYTTLTIVILGVVSDVLYNLTFGTMVFLDLPRLHKGEWTLSQRMKRIRQSGRGWRLRLADFVCERLLNPRDPSGHHC